MPNFISEDDIERAMVQRLELSHHYDSLNCFTADPADLNDGSGRTDKREVIFRDRLKEAAIELNDRIPESAIDDAISQLCDQRQAMSTIAANREVDGLIRDGPVEGLLARAVVRKEKRAVHGVPDGKSEHALQVFEAVGAFLFVEVDDEVAGSSFSTFSKIVFGAGTY